MTLRSLAPARPHRLAIAIVALAMIVGWSDAASAYTDFESSDPAEQQTVEGPVETVTVSFTNPAVPSGDVVEP